MKDEFVNRLAMFQTCLGTLNSTEHKTTWFNQPPLAVTTKVGQAVTAVADLEGFLAQHGADITGAAAEFWMELEANQTEKKPSGRLDLVSEHAGSIR